MTEDEYNLAKEIRDKADRIKDYIDDYGNSHPLNDVLKSLSISNHNLNRIRCIITEDLNAQIYLLEQQFKEL